jgi:hypothetical protein
MTVTKESIHKRIVPSFSGKGERRRGDVGKGECEEMLAVRERNLI